MMTVDKTGLGAIVERSYDDDRLCLMALADTMDAHPDEAHYRESARDALSDILEGIDDDFRDGVREMLGLRATLTMDRISAEIAAHLCIDPATACALAYWIDDHLTIEDGATGEMIASIDHSEAPDARNPLGRVRLETGVEWETGGKLVVRDLPATVLAAAVGRPLRELVSHPVLDAHALVVTGVEDDGMHQIVSTDWHRRPLTVDEIMDIRPVHTHPREPA
jgi:hypothetical protein